MSPDLFIAQERPILQLAMRTGAKQNKRVEVSYLSGASTNRGYRVVDTLAKRKVTKAS